LPGYGHTQKAILSILDDGKPRSLKEVINETGFDVKKISNSLHRLWKSRSILRSEKPTYESLRSFKGRAGIRKNTRAYHLYLYKPVQNSAFINGTRFVKYEEQVEGKENKTSKSEIIRNFLKENYGKAFYSTEVADALKEHGIKQRDVMGTVRRAEKKGLVYVRGYRTHDSQTPFREGYLLTWIDSDKPREKALEEAVEITEAVLSDKESISPIIQRVHRVRDAVIESSKLRDLASFEYIQNKLGCTDYETESAVNRTMQLYPDVKEVKLFNAFRYFYHSSLTEEDLNAAMAMKENYVRKAKGKANRIGHNWEAVPGWFIDNLTTGAKFWTQSHRNSMDPRRITIHLIKPIGGRKHNAEVDRVWEVTPGPLLMPTTYVLECKWGLVKKKHIDDFFEVLRWSKEFGADTPDGRQIKQGITGVFAGSSFDPKGSVRLKDGSTISLGSYAARMNIQLLKAVDFNEKLRNRGAPKKVTVQKICRYSRDEKEVRDTLSGVWNDPTKSLHLLNKVAIKNSELYDFERMLEKTSS
jgi:hypothetical protein